MEEEEEEEVYFIHFYIYFHKTTYD